MKFSDKGQEITYNLHNSEDDEPPLVGGSSSRAPNGFVSGGDLWTTDSDW